MVKVIKERLRGPMLLKGMYPVPLKSQSKDREPGDPTFPFAEHMLVRGGSGEQPEVQPRVLTALAGLEARSAGVLRSPAGPCVPSTWGLRCPVE